MISRIPPPVVYLMIAPLLLAGCSGGGGGGGGGSTVVTPPSPPAPPPPAPPPPPPTPQSLAFQGPYSDVKPAAFGQFTFADAAPASALAVITVTDPDVIAPTGLNQINFSGNETIHVQDRADGFTYDVTFGPSNYQGKSNLAVGSGTIPITSWSVSGNQFLVYSLTVGTAGAFSKYAALTEWIYPSTPQTHGLEIIGTPTTTALMPNSGTAHYSGQAFGYTQLNGSGYGTLSQPAYATGTVALDVDFARRAAAITGVIKFGIATFNFLADLNGSMFSSRPGRSTVDWVGGPYGSNRRPAAVSGAFYGGNGAGAAEAAGIFSDGYYFTGGFVAGANGGTPAGPVSPAPPLPPTAVAATYESPYVQFGSPFNSTSPNSAWSYGVTCQTGDASCGSTYPDGRVSAATVSIDDPDGSTANNPINFSGDEVVSGFYLGSDAFRPTAKTFKAETLTRASPNTSFSRTLPLTTWTYTDDNNGRVRDFTHYLTTIALQVGARPTSGSLATGQTANYVGLIRIDDCDPASSSCDSQFQLIGQQTTAADMPHSGSAAFDGEAYGYVMSPTGAAGTPRANGRDFLAEAHLNVDFTKTTNAITGLINDPLYQAGGTGPTPQFSISFTASIAGGRFNGTATGTGFTTTGGANDPLSGTVVGAFYGPTANPAKEAAGVFALKSTTTNGGVVGGFVTRRP